MAKEDVLLLLMNRNYHSDSLTIHFCLRLPPCQPNHQTEEIDIGGGGGVMLFHSVSVSVCPEY